MIYSRGILHDEQNFPDPMVFNPDRWLENTPPAVDVFDISFGYGRRICPGIHVARNGLWIFIATILSSFDIRQKIDPATNQPIIPEAKWTGGGIRRVAYLPWMMCSDVPCIVFSLIVMLTKICDFIISAPLPFVCEITPRSGASVDRIMEAILNDEANGNV